MLIIVLCFVLCFTFDGFGDVLPLLRLSSVVFSLRLLLLLLLLVILAFVAVVVDTAAAIVYAAVVVAVVVVVLSYVAGAAC